MAFNMWHLNNFFFIIIIIIIITYFIEITPNLHV